MREESKRNKEIIQLILVSILSLLILAVISIGTNVITKTERNQSNLEEFFTEIEIEKLKNGEPIQVLDWYKVGDGKEYDLHSAYCRIVPVKRYIGDNGLICYEVVKENNEQ
ncbi:TPA: hypothetical protein ACGO1T_001771 [Streptococcus suis]